MKSNNNKYNGSNEYQKAIDFLEKGCKCGCSSRIPKEQFAELRESFQALSKSEQDIFLMAQLKAMDGGSISTSRDALKRKLDLIKELSTIGITIHSFVKKLISICWELVGLTLKISKALNRSDRI